MASNDWMPGAIKRPVSWAQRLPRGGVTPNKFLVHITAGNADAKATGDYFERSRVACSTFCTDKDGTIYQFQPISARSGADYGSKCTLSNENVGTRGPLTDAQVTANARILAWLHDEHGINLRIIDTSATSENGLGSHRFGINGNFPTSGIQRGRLQRRPLGEKWSGAFGKTCPTDEVQDQLDDILAEAKGEKEPAKPKGPTLLKVDGVWGPAVTRSEQRRLDAPYVDGEISRQNEYWDQTGDYDGLGGGWDWIDRDKAVAGKGSQTIRLDQEDLKDRGYYKGDVDGLVGPEYFKAKQRDLTEDGYYDGAIDGEIWRPSSTVKAMQRKENARRKAAWERKHG